MSTVDSIVVTTCNNRELESFTRRGRSMSGWDATWESSKESTGCIHIMYDLK